MSNILKVVPVFGDPVKDANLAVTKYNPFYGFFGFPRKKGYTVHHGFDYSANVGTEVYAVGNGEIVQIRIGKYANKKPYPCELKNEYVIASDKTAFFFDAQKCKNCYEHCLGVQVWLKLTNDKENVKYAYYAHLSKLNASVLNNMSFIKTDEITFRPNKKATIALGDRLGESGRTGNASKKDKDNSLNIYNGYKWPPHLHFECKESTNGQIPEKGNQIIHIPNHIVNTKFIVRKQTFTEKESHIFIGKNVWEPLEKVNQQKWKDFFKERDRKQDYDSYSIVGEISPRTYLIKI